MENVEPYKNTASWHLIKTQLQRLGYTIHELTIKGQDFGVLEARGRFVAIAVTEGLFFSGYVAKRDDRPDNLGAVMDHDVPEDAYRELGYLDAKADRDKEKGKGFALQRVSAASTKVGTIGAGYAKWRSTEPHVSHPTKPGLARLLTPAEHARVKTVPEYLVDGVAPTMAHEILGQSAIFNAFVALGHSLGRMLTADKSELACEGLPLFSSP